MYALHPDKLVSVTRILARRRPTVAPDGSNMVERLAAQLHYSSLNPVAALGHEFRKTAWPKMPGRPPRIDGTVVIPGGKSAIPANKI